MTTDKDYFGETLRLAERAREEVYFRKLDQALLAQMRQQHPPETEAVAPVSAALFTSILVPVDFSPYSADAWRYAASIAARFAASLTVLHVIPEETTTHAVYHRLGYGSLSFLDPVRLQNTPTVPPKVAEDVVVNLREQAYTALQAFVAAAGVDYPVELRVLVGQPFARILDTAAREQVSLIVLGTHGRTGLMHAIMGSVAERVVRLAPCPVLTVKQTDGSDKDV